ncbi:MAG TPA: UDP-3-O-(3-hydroxymyristoyl)glucosamine N-acyltransferase [Desulfobulbaceae bacterium]|nr:UDP-3-O-(3-hydroxymyristoyl)glucosamine N-acyltransferase [Desulfobulbaceae bacterium]
MVNFYTLDELAGLVGGRVVGDGNLRVSGLNSLDLAGSDEITFLVSAKMVERLAASRAAACIVPEGVEPGRACIQVADPDYAATLIHRHFLGLPFQATGVHPTAQVGSGCEIPPAVAIGAYVCIGDRVRIGSQVSVGPGTVIGNDSIIGDNAILYANVTIYERTVIGSRVIIHSGAVIGADGFGYATDRATGVHLKKPQVGFVQIDDDVEIGANTCVDRGAFGPTRVRRGAKIDNLVMVAHNVDIGEDSILVAHVGIAGSTILGRNVVLGGMTAVKGHLQIGDRVMAAAMSGVHSNLPAGSVVGGAPAFDIKKWGRATAAYARLPEMVKEIRELRKELDRLRRVVPGAGTANEKEEEQPQ